MESTNLQEEEYHHHHQQQHLQNEQLTVGSSNSSLGSPCFGSVGTNHHAWRPSNFLLNINNNIHANCEEEEEEAGTTNSLTNSMIQNMGFAWGNPSSINDDQQQSLVSKKIIKQECSSTSSSSDHHHPPQNNNNNSSSSSNFAADMLSPPTTTSACELLLLNTISPHPMLANQDLLQLSALHHHQGGHEGVTSTNFSQIFPSVNISSLGNNNNNSNNGRNMSELVSSSGTMEMSHDSQGGLEAFAAARLLNGGSIISQGVDPSNSHLELFKFERNHRHYLQQSSDLKLWNSANNLSSLNNNGVLESKRNSCIMEPKSADHQDNQMASKKPRFESRSSCPPFKVRKEKLGDRIAALQQLVAPFGKTDTASVLMEAFGYIKFLQNQVETLSVPYMKLSSRNKQLSTKTTERVSEGYGESDEEQKLDLKSRGLCLVPVSCMTYLASDGCNGGLWPPSSFHPGF